MVREKGETIDDLKVTEAVLAFLVHSSHDL
jgi:hypothetical protein